MNLLKIIPLSIIFLSFCSSARNEENKLKSNYKFKEPKQFTITSKLNEISDLSLSSDGNLYAINDEIGIIYKLNITDGSVVKRFFLGKWTIEDDFEGIASTKNSLFALTSSGKLYKFKEGNDGEAVDYEVEQLPFSSKFDLEGFCYDDSLNGLLIVPKEYSGKNYKNFRVVYFYSLEENKIFREPIIKISLKELKKVHKINDFYPSGIVKNKINNSYFIISARDDNALVEIDSNGNILGAVKLKEKIHRQPEGIVVLDDGSIIISDEAAGKKPTLTRYQFEGSLNN